MDDMDGLDDVDDVDDVYGGDFTLLFILNPGEVAEDFEVMVEEYGSNHVLFVVFPIFLIVVIFILRFLDIFSAHTNGMTVFLNLNVGVIVLAIVTAKVIFITFIQDLAAVHFIVFLSYYQYRFQNGQSNSLKK